MLEVSAKWAERNPIKRIELIRDLSDGWDGEGSKAFSPIAIANSHRLLLHIYDYFLDKGLRSKETVFISPCSREDQILFSLICEDREVDIYTPSNTSIGYTYLTNLAYDYLTSNGDGRIDEGLFTLDSLILDRILDWVYFSK